MADDKAENWEILLPDFFNLLLDKPEKIVDDTSIEKLLAWISDVCSSVIKRQRFLKHFSSFLSNGNILKSSTTASFAMRVCGVIWCKDSEAFKNFRGWIDYFAKAKDNEMLWQEPVVRDAYFSGLSSITVFDTGLIWLQENKGCLSMAVDCMSNDSSMFVASSARLFLARYLTSTFSAVQKSHDASPWLIDILKQKITSSQQDTNATSRDRIAVLEIIRMAMDNDVICAQETLSSSKLLVTCVKTANLAEKCFCRKLVEVIGDIISKNGDTERLTWSELFCSDDQSSYQSAAQQLLKLSLDLFKRGLIVDSLYLTSSLSLMKEESQWIGASDWLSVISGLITAPLLAISDCASVDASCCNTNGVDMEPCDADSLTSSLISFKGNITRDFEAKLKTLVKPWLESKRYQVEVLIQALSSITTILSKNKNISFQTIQQWIEITLQILKGSLCTSDDPGFGLYMQGLGDKPIKSLLKALVSLVQTLIRNSDPPHLKEAYFFDVFNTFIFVARSSQTKPSIITCTFESIRDILDCGSLFLCTHSAITLENPSADDFTTKDDNVSKRNSDLRSSCKDVTIDSNMAPCAAKRPRVVGVKENVKESIGHAVHLRLLDQRWEVKDSALEFVTRLIQTNTAFSTSTFTHHILKLVWEAVDDENESYIRSSAWQAMAYIVDHDDLWATLKSFRNLTEKDVVLKILHTLESDSEAFPRRSCIDCIILWVRNRKPIVGSIFNETVESDLNAERSANSSEMKSLFARITRCAFDDFDWEVKLRGIGLIQGLLENVDGVSIKRGLNVFQGVKGLDHILRACDDCDYPVCEEALSVLGLLKNYFKNAEDRKIVDSTIENPITSVEQLTQTIVLTQEMSVEVFLDIVHRLDVTSLKNSCSAADSNLRSNAVSLLEDILACAKEDTENLLDCY